MAPAERGRDSCGVRPRPAKRAEEKEKGGKKMGERERGKERKRETKKFM